MSNTERIRYYDGEFLQSSDFDAEQSYHLSMRRRLNRYLHLYGIAYGLQLHEDTGAITQVSILPGLAIDAYGREIYLFAPYTFGDADITANRINPTGTSTYDVWIRYNKTAATPPAAGYGVCNLGTQYTRWVESYSVVLLPKGQVPFTPPNFGDPDSDDPTQDQVGVLLGSVWVDPNTPTAQFSQPHINRHVKFLGLRAQRIRPPIHATAPYPILSANTAHNPPTSIGMEGNLFAEQNLIVGSDFAIAQGAIQPTPSGSYPNPTGNTKIASDLFVQGNLYSYVPNPNPSQPQWFALADFVKLQMPMPELVVSTLGSGGLVQITNSLLPGQTWASNVISGTANVILTTSRLTTISQAVPFAYVTQFETTQPSVFSLAFASPTPNVGLQLSVNVSGPLTISGAQVTVPVNWTAGPALDVGGNITSAISQFTITCLVLCFP